MTPRDTADAFSVGCWHVHPKENRLIDGDRVVLLEPRVMSVLVCLADTPGNVLSPDEILDQVWKGRAHGDHAVYQAIADLRRALGDDAGDPRYIQTIPKRGYRLICDVSTAAAKITVREQKHSLHRLKTFAAALGLVSVAVVLLLTTISQYRNETSAANEFFEEKSIAVLPFVNMGDDPGNEDFADGVSEEIRNLLTRIPGLRVIGRSSSLAMEGNGKDRRELSRLLGIQTILGGTVRQSGDRVRIAVQLINVEDGTHIWSETYDRQVTNLFAMQDDVAAAVIDALQLNVGTNFSRGRPTESARAYALFLKARASLAMYDSRFAEKLLLEAVELDPQFAEAYELLAATYFRMGGDEFAAVDGQKLTGETAAKALAIDPDLAFAQALFHAGNIDSWSYASELAALENAARAQPNNIDLLNALLWDLTSTGYLQDALRIAERMVDLDPLSPTANARLVESLYANGRSDEATAELQLQTQLGIDLATWNLGLINLAESRDDIAISYLDSAHQRTYYPPGPDWMRDFVNNARNPETGPEFLEQHISDAVASVPEADAKSWKTVQTHWYLAFGYVDRYVNEILATNLTDSHWADADNLINGGIVYRRLGFTAHPDFLHIARTTGLMDVWEQRGPPDFCDKLDGKWVCE